MFKKNHHVRVATILQALDAEELVARGCLFGGGTAIVLSNGEYRESIDIDFLVSDLGGYRELRQTLKGDSGLAAILRKGQHLNLSREVRADQYGIRTMLDQGGVEVKFEIVFEARITLQSPGPEDRVCGVATLTRLDMATSKLLANSDRWSDDSLYSRDLIDLAMLSLPSKIFRQAIEKAAAAYGDSVEKDLKLAVENIKNRAGRLSACMSAFQMDAIPEAVLWEKIRRLLK